MRKIVINNTTWHYRIGKQNVVAHRDGDNKKYVIDFSKLMGMDWYSIEHDAWKQNFHITPANIAGWIENLGQQ